MDNCTAEICATIPVVAARSKLLRSRVSNGSKPLLGADGRSMWIRRYKDLIEDHADDYGGAAHLSVPRMSMLRRQAAAIIECEQIESRMAEGKATDDDVDRHTRITGNIRRNYEAMGMDRVARPVDGHLSISQLRAEAARTADAKQARRILAIAMVLDGHSRLLAAQP
jgi:hypothetical protein